MTILLIVSFSGAAFSQRLSRPRPFFQSSPVIISTVDSNLLKQLLAEHWSKKSGTAKQQEKDTDKMPNGFTGKKPMTIYRGNNIYESTIDHMSILAPGSDFISNMPNALKANSENLLRLQEKDPYNELNKKIPVRPF